MRVYLIVSIFLATLTANVFSLDLALGEIIHNRVLVSETVEATAIPFKKRVKEYFWSDPEAYNTIKGLLVRDKDHSMGSVIVTAGGLGYTYVNLKFKSERGAAINYDVQIFASKITT